MICLITMEQASYIKADTEREMHNRATGVDAEDYILVDSLCAELNRCLGVDCSSFQDLRYKSIRNDDCIPIISKYIPRFTNTGVASWSTR